MNNEYEWLVAWANIVGAQPGYSANELQLLDMIATAKGVSSTVGFNETRALRAIADTYGKDSDNYNELQCLRSIVDVLGATPANRTLGNMNEIDCLRAIVGSGDNGGAGGGLGAGITVSWTDNSSDEDGFRIYYGLDGVTFPFTRDVGPGITSVQIGHLIDGQQYCFYVVAFNGAGESDPTDTECAVAGTQPAAPTLVSATIPAAGTTIVKVFSAAMTIGAGGNAGWVPTLTGGAATETYASGTGTNTFTYNLNRTVLASEGNGTEAYTQPGNGIERLSDGVDLASIVAAVLTNNSTQVSGFNLTGLEAYWKLDETGTNNRVDSHGANTLAAGVTTSNEPGKIGTNAVQFNSSSTAVLSIADNASLSFGDEDMAITAWIKIATEQNSYVISKEGAINREYLIYYSVASHTPYFFVSADGTTSHSVQATSFGAMTTGVWYFIYAEHDATANTIRISVNDGTKDSAAHSGGILNGTAAFIIGEDFATTENFVGAVDEVSVWRRKLTDAEVTALYNGGTGITYPF